MRYTKRIFAIFIIFTTLLVSVSCGSSRTYTIRSCFSMDTPVEIKIDPDLANSDSVLNECVEILTELENKLSKTIDGSDIWRINSGSEAGELSEYTIDVIKKAQEISVLTNGCFDITTGLFTDMWNRCGESDSLPSSAEIAEIKEKTGFDKITLSENTLRKASDKTKVDLGGVAKGYAADILAKHLKDSGVAYGLVSFGSTVAVFGDKPDGERFKIGIKNPADTTDIIGYVYLDCGILSVTGDYERFVEIDGVRYHHVIEPATGYPTDNGLHSVVVICDDGAYSDALSTALFVMGEDAGMKLYSDGDVEFEAIFIGDSGITVTAGLNGNFEASTK